MHEIALDVPAQGAQVVFGALLAGRGQVWVDEFVFLLESASTQATHTPPAALVPEGTRNLDFEEGTWVPGEE